MKITLTKEEAKEYLAEKFQELLPLKGMVVSSVDWKAYSEDVTIIIEKEGQGEPWLNVPHVVPQSEEPL